jgi:hypothetical protein
LKVERRIHRAIIVDVEELQPFDPAQLFRHKILDQSQCKPAGGKADALLEIRVDDIIFALLVAG